MCGIAGQFHRNGQPVSLEAVKRMATLLAHRGPDDWDVWVEGSVGLAHRRLSIIDLSERGRQPMNDGNLLVYNGEIYNYKELRAELESRGHRFLSDTDSEVLLKAYREWNEDCVLRFNGMFSFAIWDPSRRRLFCARDRLGIKPFYFSDHNGLFSFASEPKALLDDPNSRGLNPRTFIRFLGEGLVDDEPETFFERVQVLPAAHRLVVTDSSLRMDRYWRLEELVDPDLAALRVRQWVENPAPLSPRFEAAPPDYLESDARLDEAAEAFRNLLTDAIRLRLRSDVPVGTCLSGGLDSSSIVCLASQLIDEPMRTFSSVYPQDDCNEKPFIDKVVAGCSTVATTVEPTAAELPEIFARLCWHQDEPTAGPGLYSQWKVMEAAHSQVTVLLDGQGGDELLAGYHHYFNDYLTTLANKLGREGESKLWVEVEAIEALTGRPHEEVASRALRRARRPRILKLFNKERPGVVKPPKTVHSELAAAARRFDQRRTSPEVTYSEVLNQKLYNDLTQHSIPALLRYEDRNSMAYSLEARVPFLDHRLVEFCFMQPFEHKIAPPHTKVLLRRAMDGYLPPEVMQRRDKMGYPTPASHWFRGPLAGWVRETLSSPSFAGRGLLNPAECLKILERHLAGEDRSWELWRFLAVEYWMREFIDGEGFRRG
ncbi:MAG: asparagine synthase (glutamine-hydrolyzing) [Candidatus Eremiobacteraeota bacterium]|nr:asparagine synthase (glutamine-hydrolyzing) [Candidatus Eremiobacteraeota bacterium]